MSDLPGRAESEVAMQSLIGAAAPPRRRGKKNKTQKTKTQKLKKPKPTAHRKKTLHTVSTSAWVIAEAAKLFVFLHAKP